MHLLKMLLSNWTSRGQFWQLKEVICVDDGGAVENRGPLFQLGAETAIIKLLFPQTAISRGSR